MVKSYEGKLMNPTIKYKGSDSNMISYLSNLWKDEVEFQSSQVDFGDVPKEINLGNFKNTLSKVSDNLVLSGGSVSSICVDLSPSTLKPDLFSTKIQNQLTMVGSNWSKI